MNQTDQLYMYAITWNEHIKDIVIAHNDEEAFDIAAEPMVDCNVSRSDVTITKLDDDLQTITTRFGLLTVRQIIEHYGEPAYVRSIDDKQIQF